MLELAAQGMTNGEIGERLYISESTVRFHVQKLKEKFSARTKTELIAKAIRTGFIAPALEDGISTGRAVSAAVSPDAPGAAASALDELAAAAQRTLGCETVVITLRRRSAARRAASA